MEHKTVIIPESFLKKYLDLGWTIVSNRIVKLPELKQYMEYTVQWESDTEPVYPK